MTGAELAAVIQGIRDRVKARYPEGAAAEGVPLADLTPVVHARDAAEAKTAAIGTVNPRPAGLVHSVVQALKKLTARALDWHVREQVEFKVLPVVRPIQIIGQSAGTIKKQPAKR